MAQTGYTPILIYGSSTGGNAPAAGSLTNSTLGSELAINITDGKLFYKDNANVIQVIGWKVRPATAGGTGLTSFAVGDLLYADTTTTLAKLADVATGNALISGGVGVAPSWGKIGLTTHVSGILPTANGGTNLSSFTANGVFYATSTSAIGQSANLTFNGTTLSTVNLTASGEVTSTTDNARFSLYRSTGTNYFDWASGQTLAFGTQTSQGGAGRVNKVNFTDAGNIEIANGNLVISTSGKGIDFSATPSTGTSELLADYEEGTWTPVVTSTVGSLSSVSATGTYTKIGREVTVFYNILISGNGTGATSIKAAGLPYTIAANRPYGVGNETDAVGFNIISQGIVATDYALILNFAGLYPGGSGYRLQGNFTYIV